MATVVVLEVTPPTQADPHRDYTLPEDLASVLAEDGLVWAGAMSRSGGGPGRLNVRVSGPDRMAIGQRLKSEVAWLGYQVDLRILR